MMLKKTHLHIVPQLYKELQLEWLFVLSISNKLIFPFIRPWEENVSPVCICCNILVCVSRHPRTTDANLTLLQNRKVIIDLFKILWNTSTVLLLQFEKLIKLTQQLHQPKCSLFGWAFELSISLSYHKRHFTLRHWWSLAASTIGGIQYTLHNQ